MELKNFLKLFREFPQIDQTAKVLSRPNSHIHWKGHVGSSRSISAIAVAEQTPGHHVFILNDKEEAAYFLNDLEETFILNGYEGVDLLMFQIFILLYADDIVSFSINYEYTRFKNEKNILKRMDILY